MTVNINATGMQFDITSFTAGNTSVTVNNANITSTAFIFYLRETTTNNTDTTSTPTYVSAVSAGTSFTVVNLGAHAQGLSWMFI